MPGFRIVNARSCAPKDFCLIKPAYAWILLSELRQANRDGDREAFAVGFAGFSLDALGQAAIALGAAVIAELAQGVLEVDL
jgi:hypothetical protein